MALAKLTKFAKLVAKGSSSSSSVDQEIGRADQEISGEDHGAAYYGLEGAFDESSDNTKRSIMSRVVSGELNPALLLSLLPSLAKIDPGLIKFFTQGDGSKLLQLISSAYTNQRLDLSILDSIVTDPGAREALDRVRTNYQEGGMDAVNMQDLVSIFNSLDFGAYVQDSKPISELFAEIVATRTVNASMINKHLSQLRRAREERKEEMERAMEEQRIEKEKQEELEAAAKAEAAATDRTAESSESEAEAESDTAEGQSEINYEEESPEISSLAKA